MIQNTVIIYFFKIHLLYLTLGSLLGAQTSHAESYRDPIILSENKADYPIGLQSYVLKDATGQLDLAAVQAAWKAGAFDKEKSEAPNYGFTTDTHWYRFAAKNESPTPQTWYFVLESPLIDQVILYKSTKDSYQEVLAGDRIPFDRRDLKSRFFILKIDFVAGEQKDFYLKLKTEGSADFRMSFRTLTHIYTEDHDAQMFQGAYIGILCVMIAYFGLLALGSRKLDLFALSFYLLTLMIFKLSSNGVAFEYLWPEYPAWANTATVFSVPLVFLGASLNAYSFLPVKESRRLMWIYRAYIAVLSACCLGALIGPYRLVKLYTVIGITTSFYILVSSGIYYLRGFKPARFFILAWSSLLMGSIVYGLQKLGLVPISFITINGVEIATFAFVVLLALGTSDKYNEVNKALTKAQADALSAQIEANRLTEEMNTQLETQVQQRTAQLWQKTKGMSVMLENIEQGICTIDSKLTIQAEYSPFLEKVLGESDLSGKNIEQFLLKHCKLDQEHLDMIHSVLSVSFDEDALSFSINSHILPRNLEVTVDGQARTLEIDWAAIENQNDEIQQILISIRDVTKARIDAAIVAAKQQELEVIGRILELSATKFRRFMRSATTLIEDSRQILESPTANTDYHIILRNIHTIKGNARTYGLDDVSQLVHQVENELFAYSTSRLTSQDLALIEKQLRTIEDCISFYRTVHDDKLKRGAQAEQEALLGQLSIMLHDVWNELSNSIRLKFHSIFQKIDKLHTNTFRKALEPLALSLEGLARQLGKNTPSLHIRGTDFYIDPDNLSLFEDIFVHMVRNSLDHGFIQGDDGVITLDLDHKPDETVLVYRDNGRGLNLPVLRRKAIEQGIIGEEADQQTVADAIFCPGVSSARVVTEISGRGVGMDAVRACVQRLRGHIEIRLIGDGPLSGHKRIEFRMTLPPQNTIIASLQYSAA